MNFSQKSHSGTQPTVTVTQAVIVELEVRISESLFYQSWLIWKDSEGQTSLGTTSTPRRRHHPANAGSACSRGLRATSIRCWRGSAPAGGPSRSLSLHSSSVSAQQAAALLHADTDSACPLAPSCSGTVRFAHESCITAWAKEKWSLRCGPRGLLGFSAGQLHDLTATALPPPRSIRHPLNPPSPSSTFINHPLLPLSPPVSALGKPSMAPYALTVHSNIPSSSMAPCAPCGPVHFMDRRLSLVT